MAIHRIHKKHTFIVPQDSCLESFLTDGNAPYPQEADTFIVSKDGFYKAPYLRSTNTAAIILLCGGTALNFFPWGKEGFI
jgi:hypothetical protein